VTEQINIEVPLKVRACTCGAIWAVNWYAEGVRCPACAGRTIRGLEEALQGARDRTAVRDRKISHLKGALTRAKARHG
jgi:hypothetical protein